MVFGKIKKCTICLITTSNYKNGIMEALYYFPRKDNSDSTVA